MIVYTLLNLSRRRFYENWHKYYSNTVFDVPNKFKSKFNYSYVPDILKDIENKWKDKVDKHWIKATKQISDSDSSSKYVLSMFPYPSGQLHLGHTRIYTTVDILFKTSILCGQKIINPMGFDSFGLPAENAARINNKDPFIWTSSNIEQMKNQMNNLGYHFHWRENTSDPSYYRWTQWLFIELFKSNLAYQGVSQVNWDPIDCTVLADEQVDSEGKSWRSGALVEKRFHKQWFIKTNAFANDLYLGEDIIDTGHWSFILAHQRWWIKKPNGYLFYLNLTDDKSKFDNQLLIFTPHPELFYYPETFVGISSLHWLSKGKKCGEIVGKLKNPFRENQIMNIQVIDYEHMPNSTQATLMIEKENVFDENKRMEIVNKARSNYLGGYFTSNTYRDWLISRQRFWGTPIPIIHCSNCGPVPVNEQELPVVLPKIDYSKISNYSSNEISSPLKQFAPQEWLKVKCPQCQSPNGTRETDTCDTFFDSSWYFLRYFAEPYDSKPFDKFNLRAVDCYVGGKEHSALHLFYARFITHFLHSKGYLNFKEPFHTLLMQAIVKARTYKLNGKYISSEEAMGNDNVKVSFEKMSKSKGTGVDPDYLIEKFSYDAVRWTIISVGNPESERLWDTEEKEFGPTFVFFHRILLTIEEYLAAKNGKLKIKNLEQSEFEIQLSKFNKTTDNLVFNILFSIFASYQIRNGTSSIHKLINLLRSNINNNIVLTKEYERALASLIIMLVPFVPCFSSECWQEFTSNILEKNNECSQLYGFNYNENVLQQKWPKIIDPNFLYIVRFTFRNEKGREEEYKRIKIPLKLLGSWNEDEILNLFKSINKQIEWIEIVKNCSIIIRLKSKNVEIPMRNEFVDVS